jgi:hypothetical protein
MRSITKIVNILIYKYALQIPTVKQLFLLHAWKPSGSNFGPETVYSD